MKILVSPYSKPMRNGKENPKNFPYWEKVISLLIDANHSVTQVGASGERRIKDDTISPSLSYSFDYSMKELAGMLKEFDTFISVDNFFHHFAHYYDFYGIVLFSRSDPAIYGYPENINLLKDKKFLRKDQFGLWESCDYIQEAFVNPEYVIKAVEKFN